MVVQIDLTVLLAALGLPSAVLGFGIWLIQRKITKRDERLEKAAAKEQNRQELREKDQSRYQQLSIKSTNASLALGEATANAIKKGHANGDMEAALQYAKDVKHELKDFITKKASQKLS